MLRKGLLVFAALLVLIGIVRALEIRSLAGLGPAGFGAILLLAILIERRGYKRIEDNVPGPDWQPTGERFLEPGSGTPVAVYFHPASGKRAYVRTVRN
jgi:hypothetical protein